MVPSILYKFPHIHSTTYKVFRASLGHFAALVKSGLYDKLDYKMWKHFAKERPEDSEVYFGWDETKCTIVFSGEKLVHTIVEDDNSFGMYLYDHMLDDSEWLSSPKGENMPTKNDNPNFWEGSLTTAVNDSYSADKTNTIRTNVYDSYGLTVGSGWDNATIEICGLNQKADKAEVEEMYDRIKKIENEMKAKNEKENEKMKFNFDFGPVDSNSVRMSMYGLAIKNRDGVWVSYDSNGNQVMDVDVLNFDGAKFMYKMPVAIKDIAAGDIVVHNHKPMFVTEVTKTGIAAMDIYEGEMKVIVPTVNMFGFNFVTKIVSLVNFGTPTADQPFGNMLPFMLMGESKNDKHSMLMMAMAMNGGMNANMMSNPLMMIALMGDKDIDPGMLMYLAMQNQNHCNCGNHEHDGEHKCNHEHDGEHKCNHEHNGEHKCNHGNGGCCGKVENHK